MFQHIKTFICTTLIACTLMLSPAMANQPVNINTAGAQEIALNLTGIGSSKASAIVTYREQHGQFQHMDELVNVKGIGLSTIEKNRELILVSESQSK